MSEVSARAKKVLHAVVSEFLTTGEAVGSETVARRYGLDVSPATVRNVMGDLEALGLLRHPHASAGRVPTDRGLRFYVDALLRVRSLSAVEQGDIRERLAPGPTDVGDVLRRTTRVLRDLSRLAVIVQTPRPESDPIAHIEFLRLREGQLFCVLASSTGQVQNKIVPIDFVPEPGELERINNFLSQLIKGLTLGEARARLAQELETERAAHAAWLRRGLTLAEAAVPAPTPGEIWVDGQSNLLEAGADPEAIERAKNVMRALEEKDRLVRLLDRTLQSPGLSVFIGSEANLPDVTDVSVVAASYGGEGRPVGTIGVIGPSRMNYSKLIALVDFTAEVITEALPKL